MLLLPLDVRASVPIGGSKIDHKDVWRRPNFCVIWVPTINLQASSVDMLFDFIVNVHNLVVILPGLSIEVHKNVVRLDVPVDVTQCMQVLHVLNHLDANLQHINLLEVFLVFVKDRAHSFPKFVLHKEFGLVINLLNLVSFLQASHSPVLQLWKAVEVWGWNVL